MFDEILDQLRGSQPVTATMAGLISNLSMQRREAGAEEWRRFVQAGVRQHPMYSMLLEDPMVRHSTERPRGYPGDAELLDYIYGAADITPHIDGASALGRRLYDFDKNAPGCVAVRNRLQMAAAETDRLAAAGGRPDVLSIACGHLREAGMLRSLHNGTMGRLVGVDQDALSVQHARDEWGHLGVDVQRLDARMLIHRGLQTLGRFDFIYALGLYDYLSDRAGARLLQTAVDMLKPGGKVWVANFLQDIWVAGYMEAVMDWWLTYRSEEQMPALMERLDPAKVASYRVFVEPEHNVTFLEVVRA